VRLAAAGQEVWGLRRDPAGLPAPIRPLAADLGEPATLECLAGLAPDAVVYVASADAFDEAAYRRVYVEGVRNLLAALAVRPPARLLYVSSTGVYGQTAGEWVDERSPAEPGGFSGRCLLEGENLALGRGRPSVVVRFGGIYGPGRTRLVEAVRRGEACGDSPPRYTNRIHRDDCAAVLEHLLGLPSPEALYLGVDCLPAPECEVMDWLADALGVPRPPRGGGSAPGPQRGNRRCRNDRLLASGYRFRYPTYREGYRAVLGAQGPGAGGQQPAGGTRQSGDRGLDSGPRRGFSATT
jgi:nucleoside-diphosphate-sugar epimerase